MKAFVYHGPKNMSLDQVPDPKILKPTDAIVKVTTSTICGTDKHIRNGGMPEVESGRIIGHEFCGEVIEIGTGVNIVNADYIRDVKMVVGFSAVKLMVVKPITLEFLMLIMDCT